MIYAQLCWFRVCARLHISEASRRIQLMRSCRISMPSELYFELLCHKSMQLVKLLLNQSNFIREREKTGSTFSV